MNREPWTDSQLALLRAHYADTLTADLAKRIGRPEKSVYQKAAALGLRKSEAFLSSINSGRLDGVVGTEFRFKPGIVPWNKGTNFVAGGRSAETRFKKGRPAEEARNYVPIGSLRITNDGILERKITDDPSIRPARRWVGVHRLVWEAANGPVPTGQAVVFREGRRSTDPELITLDCLELVTRAELMRRNSYHNRYPKEVCLAIQLRGALMRKINRLTQEATP